MKPGLTDAFLPDWAGHPQQMSANDREIWTTYREILPEVIKSLYFNVPVGDPILFSEGLEEDMVRVVNAVSRRRIDVVGEAYDAWYLIELRWNAGPGAIGSVLCYKALWEEDPPDNKQVTPVIVTNYTDENLIRASKKYNIMMHVI